jgi:hypothetical protein
LCVLCLPFLRYCFRLTGLIQKDFSAVLLVEFMFGRLLSWIFTAFTNSTSLHFEFSYSAVLSLLYMLLLSVKSLLLFLSFYIWPRYIRFWMMHFKHC